jgi:hypothetical protein
MRAELTQQQVDSVILSMDAAISQLGFAKLRHEEFSGDIEKDIGLVQRIKDKVLLINKETFTALTKYETYTLINIASDFEELHEQPQDTLVNKVMTAKLNILDVLKSPLPYIDVIFIKMARE